MKKIKKCSIIRKTVVKGGNSMKNVVVTGAANGVGKAIANLLKNEKLILIDIDEENLKIFLMN